MVNNADLVGRFLFANMFVGKTISGAALGFLWILKFGFSISGVLYNIINLSKDFTDI